MAIQAAEDMSLPLPSHPESKQQPPPPSRDLTPDPICTICHSPYNTLQPDGTIESPVVLPCSHIFGSLCIAEWLESSAHQDCPHCRREMRYTGCGHVVIPKPVPLSFLLPKPEGAESESETGLSGKMVKREDMPSLCLVCRESKEMGDVVRRAEKRLAAEEIALGGLSVLEGVFGGLYKSASSVAGIGACLGERRAEVREKWKSEMRILRQGLKVMLEGREEW